MMSFYNYKYQELQSLQANVYLMLSLGMKKVKAREKLELMESVSYPHTKDKERRNIHKRTYKLSQTEEAIKQRAVKTEDLNKIYGDFGSIEAVIKGK